jgi:hypothetical protein
MVALRYVYVLALVVWLGGMVVLGAVVAPATFQVLEAQAPQTGRVLAGAVFGLALDRFQYVAYGCGLLVLLSLAVMAVLGPRPAAFAVRSAIAAAMLGVALYLGFVVYRNIDLVQHEIGAAVSPSTLPQSDPRRLRFDHLHELSTRLMMVNMVGALVLLYWQARE